MEINVKVKKKLTKQDKKRIKHIVNSFPTLLGMDLYNSIVKACAHILEIVEDPEDRKQKWEEIYHELNRPE